MQSFDHASLRVRAKQDEFDLPRALGVLLLLRIVPGDAPVHDRAGPLAPAAVPRARQGRSHSAPRCATAVQAAHEGASRAGPRAQRHGRDRKQLPALQPESGRGCPGAGGR